MTATSMSSCRISLVVVGALFAFGVGQTNALITSLSEGTHNTLKDLGKPQYKDYLTKILLGSPSNLPSSGGKMLPLDEEEQDYQQEYGTDCAVRALTSIMNLDGVDALLKATAEWKRLPAEDLLQELTSRYGLSLQRPSNQEAHFGNMPMDLFPSAKSSEGKREEVVDSHLPPWVRMYREYLESQTRIPYAQALLLTLDTRGHELGHMWVTLGPKMTFLDLLKAAKSEMSLFMDSPKDNPFTYKILMSKKHNCLVLGSVGRLQGSPSAPLGSKS